MLIEFWVKRKLNYVGNLALENQYIFFIGLELIKRILGLWFDGIIFIKK